MAKQVVLALSERAARVIYNALDNYQPQPGLTVEEADAIIAQVKREIDDWLSRDQSTNARPEIPFGDGDPTDHLTKSGKPDRRRIKNPSAATIAKRMAKAAKEATDG